jgi:Ca2+-transporting ATPase
MGMEEAEPGIMKRQPRDESEGIFAGGLGIDCLVQGAIIAGLTIISYFIGLNIEGNTLADVVSGVADGRDGMTMAFLTLSLCEMLHAWNMRSLNGSIFTMRHHNPMLLGSILLSFVLTVPILLIPALRSIFSLAALTWQQYLCAALLAAAVVPVVEIVKAARAFLRKRRI